MAGFRKIIGDSLRKLHFEDRVKQFVKAKQLWDRYETPPELIALPEGERILVLAPHMDDEVIGCGGTLRKCVLAGKRVKVVFMTDGRFGDDRLANLSGQALQDLQQQVMHTRKLEALRAGEILGAEPPIFFDAVDAHLQSTDAIRGQLGKVLDEFRPDAVFTPFFTEDHKDHRQTTQVLLDTVETGDYRFECYCYEVWTPLFPNCLVDISDTMACKREALQAHASQLQGIDYQRAMDALTRYRAMRISRDGYAEAFFRLPIADMRAFAERLATAG